VSGNNEHPFQCLELGCVLHVPSGYIPVGSSLSGARRSLGGAPTRGRGKVLPGGLPLPKTLGLGIGLDSGRVDIPQVNAGPVFFRPRQGPNGRELAAPDQPVGPVATG